MKTYFLNELLKVCKSKSDDELAEYLHKFFPNYDCPSDIQREFTRELCKLELVERSFPFTYWESEKKEYALKVFLSDRYDAIDLTAALAFIGKKFYSNNKDRGVKS